jgi:hypothetical protein
MSDKGIYPDLGDVIIDSFDETTTPKKVKTRKIGTGDNGGIFNLPNGMSLDDFRKDWIIVDPVIENNELQFPIAILQTWQPSIVMDAKKPPLSGATRIVVTKKKSEST